MTETTPHNNRRRSSCPVAGTLDILGDKWSLVVIRDLLMGLNTYKQLQSTPEGIPTNILASRLKRLQAQCIIDKTLYQEKPKRYQYLLTPKGLALAPAIAELAKWGLNHIENTHVHPNVQAAIDAQTGA